MAKAGSAGGSRGAGVRAPAGRARESGAIAALRFVTADRARVEFAPWGKHWWLSQPELTGTNQLILVRVRMRPGTGHQFHYHPAMEEIIYIERGVAEQWVDREKRTLKAGEMAFIPKTVVHAIYNRTKRPMTFLAMLSPARVKGPFLVDVYRDAPWRNLVTPVEYPPVDPRTGRALKPEGAVSATGTAPSRSTARRPSRARRT